LRGVILAGGAASRFGGRPKGLESVGGRRILDRLVAAFESALGAPPLLVANDPAAREWCPGLEVVADRTPGLGALGGIWTAVAAGPAPVVVAAWDMPFVSAELLRRLAAGLEEHDACLPASDGPRGVEPLCAAYGPACGPAIEAALARGDRRAIGFHREVRVRIIPVAEIATLGDPARLFFNVNTTDDLTLANGMA
jgi:molybdopterin-guanine dinucleotide biosynthesis protein A